MCRCQSGDDPLDFRSEGESDGAEAQVTKQEGGQRSALGIRSLVFLTDPKVRFTLAYEWGQWCGSCMCPSSAGVLQGKKRSCANGKDKVALSSLCRTRESDALF